MTDLTAETFAHLVSAAGLLDHLQLEAAWGEIGTRDISLDDFISYMLRKELLTRLHVERLQQGERYGYFYGKYKLLYVAGRGTFARVYRAAHVDTGDVVAVKVLRAQHSTNPIKREQFLTEGELVEKLRHVNIVPVYEVGEERDRPYMVMEFVEGHTLRDFLRIRKKFEVEEALKLIEDIATGLDYAASRDVTHRDLKVSNVLVTSDGVAKLVDFGLAAIAALHREGGEGMNERSIDYGGLERVTGVRKEDPRSDIYFAGCILYHMLTGVPPLNESKERAQRLSASRFRDFKPIIELDPSLPDSIVALVAKAMDLDANRRFQTPGEFQRQIAQVKRLVIDGELDDGEEDTGIARRGKTDREGEGHSVMVVESNIEMQDALRNLLKRRGYRVLVIGNAERALQRFAEEPPAECAIFSTTEMGQEAVDAFNKFGEMDHTKHIPAILFLDEKRQDMAGLAQVTDHRVLLPMPLKVRQLRAILLKVISGSSGETD